MEIKIAEEFATKKHQGQFRKFSLEPYITHPTAVAEKLMTFTNDTELICAAYLHDTLEDTDTTEAELRQNFGVNITNLVVELTSVDFEEMGLRKEEYLTKKLNSISPRGRLLKWTDRWQNVSDLLDGQTPESFRIGYAKQTSYILDHIEFTPPPKELTLIRAISAIIQEILEKD